MTERLTTLTAVKEWLGFPADNTAGDAQLLRLIDAASRFILNYISWPTLQRQTYTDTFRGNGKSTMQLANWPVLSITSVGLNGTVINASPAPVNGQFQSGYLLTDPRNGPQSLDLFGYAYGYRVPGQIVYDAGFETRQTQVLETVESVTAVVPDNMWLANVSVTIDGVAATQVTVAPAAGEYQIVDGVYIFSDDDAGKVASIIYSYVPADIHFAATTLIGEWYRAKERIGVLSKTLGGQETVTFGAGDLSPIAVTSLQPYRKVI